MMARSAVAASVGMERSIARQHKAESRAMIIAKRIFSAFCFPKARVAKKRINSSPKMNMKTARMHICHQRRCVAPSPIIAWNVSISPAPGTIEAARQTAFEELMKMFSKPMSTDT